MSKTMVLKPRISEKAYGLSEALNTYMFNVPVGASKLAVKLAIEQQYSVGVIKVNIANSKGKLKRTVRRGGRSVNGRRSDTRKAYVTLKEGDNLPFFAPTEEANTTAKPEPKRRAAKEAR